MLSSGAAGFHFAEPQWLPALLLIPLLWGMYRLFRANTRQGQKLREFADAHLLPHLLEDHRAAGGGFSALHSLTLWSIVWACAVLAMAGPRWDYTDTKVYRPASELIILLDLSRSMDVADVKPSRLVRARQEIGDVLHYSEGVNIGLVAFAKIPHMIAPLTDDRQTLMRLLPSIKTELVYTQGSRLVQALDMAGRMLSQDQAKIERHVLILSDGGYEDPEAQIYRALRALTDRGVRVHVMGVGTSQGGPVPNGQGGFYRGRIGSPIMAPADFARLRSIARDGQGLYLDATYQQEDTRAFLDEIGVGKVDEQNGERVIRQWEERFYIFLLPGLLLILTWFRRGIVFPVVLLTLAMTSTSAQADGMRDYFLTEEQRGRKALEERNYQQAEEIFKDDAYRRGVVQYKAGDYESAAESFERADRPEIAEDARYNLGNAQLMAGQIEDAIKAYEEVLKGNPEHQDAAHNLEIARKMLEERNQDQNSDQGRKNQSDQDQQQAEQKPQQGQKSQEPQKDQNPDSRQPENSEQAQGERQQSEGQEKAQKDQGEQQQQGEQNSGQEGSASEGEQKQAQSESDNKSQEKSSEGSEGYPPQPGKEQKKSEESSNPKQAENGQEENPSQEQKQAADSQEEAEERNESGQKASEDKAEQQQEAQQRESQQDSGSPEGQKDQEPSESPAEMQNKAQKDFSGTPDNKPADTRPRLADGPVEPQGQGQQVRTPQDVDADRWLERIHSDTETFLKNKFYVESETQGAREGDKPW